MQELILGIDLGTTNSEVAILKDGQPYVIPGDDGDPILPSVVGLAEDGRLLVGKPARNQFVLAPDRTIKSVKRQMGTENVIHLGGQKFRPQEISAMILRALKDRAEKHLGRPVQKAVITVPAYFNDSQRQATREAGQLAGLDVVRIINEPTAASLTYHPQPSGSEKILVYDLGGGTFDVSIVQCEAGVFEVLASHGDTKLGGDDFDNLLVDHVADHFQGVHDVDLRASRVSRNRLLHAVEEAKKKLSDHPFARIEEEFIAEKDGVPLHLNFELDRADFEDLIKPLVEKTMECVNKALQDANVTVPQIRRVVLVGGSTRTPMIGRLLESKLGQPAHREVNPDLCVAMGASVQGAIVAGEKVSAVLVDITPHSLGIRTLDLPMNYTSRPNEFHFVPIIRRNTPLPTSQSEVFSTVYDNQPRVEIDVYQGEYEDVRRNHRVGKFMVEGLARAPAGNPILVQLDLTLDGTLKVSAREKATGLHKQITIENALTRYALEERGAAQERLNRLWEVPPAASGEGDADGDADGLEPSELAAPRPGDDQRRSVQALALIEKAERIRAKASSDDQAELDRLIVAVKSALEAREWESLSIVSGQLSDVLFYLEDA